MTRSIYLHAGLPKTGSTALQSWFHTNRAQLAAAGLEYPDRHGGGPQHKHQFLIQCLRSGNMDRVEQVLEGAARPHILMSAEGLSNHLDDFRPDALRHMRRLMQPFSVKLLLFVRPAGVWAKSFYKQALKLPRNGLHPLWGTDLALPEFAQHPRVRHLLAHDALASDLAGAFDAQVTVSEYDDGVAKGAADWLGLDTGGMTEMTHRNASIPDWGAEVLRRANELGMPEVDRARLVGWLEKTTTAEGEDASGIPYPGQYWVDAVKKRDGCRAVPPLTDDAHAFLKRLTSGRED